MVLPKGYRPGPRDRSGDKLATMGDFPSTTTTPDSLNWFLQSRVTDVRNQGQCGDCWAESATAVLESLYEQQSGKLTQLSVQQAAECTGPEYNRGCGGGWPVDVFWYVKNSSLGLCSEVAYPTEIGDGTDRNCNATLAKQCNIPLNITKILSVPQDDEAILLKALQGDVVSVAIDASGMGFYSYFDGVYDGTFNGQPDCTTTALDHAVVATGYGTYLDGNIPFYIVRNSWGVTGWGGLNGYVLFRRGNNTCGIAHDATFVR